MNLPPDLWAEFRKHRKAIRAPMTEYAEKLILAKLEKFAAAGHDPVTILETSIENGWRGVFEPKQHGNSAPWWSSNEGIQGKAFELGIMPKKGESWQDLRARINTILNTI